MDDETLSMRQNVGLVIFTITAGIPGLILGGIMPEINVLPLWGWLLFACVGTGIAGAIAGERRPLLLAGIGAFTGPLMLVSIVFYIEMRASLSDTFLSVEFLIPGVLACLPGIGLWKLADVVRPLPDE